ncbi:MAG: bifunctional riboflavin kinase/FAD synthetase [candidate division WOR-3 bacterium]
MRIYQLRLNKTYPDLFGSVITIGSFDGVHRGHQKIISVGKSLAKKHKRLFGIITFTPNPYLLINKDYHFLLTSDDEKIRILQKLAIDYLGLIKFTNQIKETEPQQFLINYIIKTIKPSVIVVGYDHHFGKGQKGNINLLKKLSRQYQFKTIVASTQRYHRAPIKSTRIRELLILGHIERANELLGYPYTITGSIIKGKGLAKQLGFPTLNLRVLNKAKLIPADGVYYVKAIYHQRKYDGVMNIGFAPTAAEQLKIKPQHSLEVHLFNFQQELKEATHQPITIEFYKRLRPEKKFENLEQLKQQIAEDIKMAKELTHLR